MFTKEELEKLRLHDSMPTLKVTQTDERKVKPKDSRFLKGPIPWNWLSKAARQPGRALHVAVSIWFWSGILKTKTFKFSVSKMSELGLDRYAGYRGLNALESAGLISVDGSRGRSPIVTILD